MMDSITDFSRSCCEDRITFLKKMIRGQIAWALFMLAITAYDCQTLYLSPSAFSGLAVGAMLITLLWALLFLSESMSDLKGEKLKFRYLTELRDKQLASGEREQYINAKKFYEQALANLTKATPTDEQK